MVPVTSLRDISRVQCDCSQGELYACSLSVCNVCDVCDGVRDVCDDVCDKFVMKFVMFVMMSEMLRHPVGTWSFSSHES